MLQGQDGLGKVICKNMYEYTVLYCIVFHSRFDKIAVGSGRVSPFYGNLGIRGENLGHEREISGDRQFDFR